MNDFLVTNNWRRDIVQYARLSLDKRWKQLKFQTPFSVIFWYEKTPTYDEWLYWRKKSS